MTETSQAKKATGVCLAEELAYLRPGHKDALAYQKCVGSVFGWVFDGYLCRQREEVRYGNVRFDSVFRNLGNGWFWKMLMHSYDAFHVILECKNSDRVKPDHVTQLASYLGGPFGRAGFLVSRRILEAPVSRRAQHFFLNEQKLILHLSNKDLELLTQLRSEGREVNELLSCRYEDFLSSI